MSSWLSMAFSELIPAVAMVTAMELRVGCTEEPVGVGSRSRYEGRLAAGSLGREAVVDWDRVRDEGDGCRGRPGEVALRVMVPGLVPVRGLERRMTLLMPFSMAGWWRGCSWRRWGCRFRRVAGRYRRATRPGR